VGHKTINNQSINVVAVTMVSSIWFIGLFFICVLIQETKSGRKEWRIATDKSAGKTLKQE
jgi:arginine exporter protein ArgO